ncbi:AvrD family protein [Streptomyces sp. CA-132043]|uniref:AvrD family protein n=1 Tax=Streptomyces sp. CA-132043 TaxID=3240048 RepID=UPI003D8C317B
MIDCFVTNLQLAQILMYELDGVRRAESNTLWMLRTVLSADADERPEAGSAGETGSGSLPLHMRLTGKHLLPLRGATWRNVEVAGGLGGISLRCSLAHELPAAAAAVAV